MKNTDEKLLELLVASIEEKRENQSDYLRFVQEIAEALHKQASDVSEACEFCEFREWIDDLLFVRRTSSSEDVRADVANDIAESVEDEYWKRTKPVLKELIEEYFKHNPEKQEYFEGSVQ